MLALFTTSRISTMNFCVLLFDKSLPRLGIIHNSLVQYPPIIWLSELLSSAVWQLPCDLYISYFAISQSAIRHLPFKCLTSPSHQTSTISLSTVQDLGYLRHLFQTSNMLILISSSVQFQLHVQGSPSIYLFIPQPEKKKKRGGVSIAS